MFVFDYDGTLAPLVAVPEQAYMRARTDGLLQRLAESRPVAIVSGRGVEDLAHRVSPDVRYLIGNHGNEGLPNLPEHIAARRAACFRTICSAWIEQLEGEFDVEALWPGTVVEDKGLSLSLHFRHVPHPDVAEPAIRQWLDKLEPAPRIIEGHHVFNLLPEDAVTKREAVAALAKVCECQRIVFLGDDVTDELAFADAPAEWITVRIGSTAQTAARWRLADQSVIDDFLERVLVRSGL
jgi:trehalose 6-phosphate phosphatase